MATSKTLTRVFAPGRRRDLFAWIALAAAIHAAGWVLAAQEMRRQVDRWIETQRHAGVQIDHKGYKIGGYPFFVRITIGEPTIAWPEGSWASARVHVDLSATRLNALAVHTPDKQRVTSSALPAPLVLESQGRLVFTRASAADGWSVEIDAPSGGAAYTHNRRSVSLGSLNLAIAPAPDNPADLIIIGDMHGAIIGGGQDALERASLTIIITKTDAALKSNSPAFWAQSGGVLAIEEMRLLQGPGTAIFKGDLSIDQNGRMLGHIDADITAPASFTALLGAWSLLSPQEAEAAGAALTLAGIVGGGALKGPITFENGAVALAGARLGDAPQVIPPH